MARRRSIWKGAVAGLAGGLVASWVMNEAQAGLAAAVKKLNQNGKRSEQESSEDSDDATMKVAGKISQKVLHRSLSKREKRQGGSFVHYAFGTAIGGLYGVMTEASPHAKRGFGLPFGTALFVGADEVAVPVLGLSPSPLATKAQDHLYALASHFVYGATTELVRRGVRACL